MCPYGSFLTKVRPFRHERKRRLSFVAPCTPRLQSANVRAVSAANVSMPSTRPMRFPRPCFYSLAISAPIVTSISPSEIPLLKSALLTISGAFFRSAHSGHLYAQGGRASHCLASPVRSARANVRIGQSNCTSISVLQTSQITCRTPATFAKEGWSVPQWHLVAPTDIHATFMQV